MGMSAYMKQPIGCQVIPHGTKRVGRQHGMYDLTHTAQGLSLYVRI